MKTLKINNFEPLTFDELEDFTLKSYVKLLQYLNQIYKIVPFCEIPRKDVPYLILRHDIDVSLPAALKMAQIERDLGVKSTYFVLFSSRFYNLLEGNNIDTLRQISKLGHEVGLHYYVSQYLSYNRNPKGTLKKEIQLLEHLLGRRVYSIARHGPWDRDPFAAIKEYINANHPHLRRDLFIHDSCRAWTSLQGLFELLNDPPRRVQLLIHPENWRNNKVDRQALLETFFRSKENEIFTLSKNMSRTWSRDPLVLEYDALIKGGNLKQLYERESKADSKTRLGQELNYYNKQVRWYLINTPLGWRFHKTIEKIRKILKYMRGRM